MNILISNDDGIFALGIRALANACAEAGHQVTIVCPDRERSATGHGLTLQDPIRTELVPNLFHPSITAWACSGTPADCVKLALGALLDRKPDIVLSGINHGPNLGTDVLYSGTVSAAMEGLLDDIPSLAFSLAKFGHLDFSAAAQFAVQAIAQFSAQPPARPMLLNVNIPAGTAAEIAGVKLTKLGFRRYHDLFEKRVDPRGRTYYWLSGEVLEEIDPETMPGGQSSPLMTDVEGIRQNYITLTPLHFNLTDWAAIDAWQPWVDHVAQAYPIGEAGEDSGAIDPAASSTAG
ncbi:MAG TPA: 5'/3'-nucleotidase SurE [Coleofasciculaceae cyanobacterium]